jgi:hypothetical protein
MGDARRGDDMLLLLFADIEFDFASMIPEVIGV